MQGVYGSMFTKKRKLLLEIRGRHGNNLRSVVVKKLSVMINLLWLKVLLSSTQLTWTAAAGVLLC